MLTGNRDGPTGQWEGFFPVKITGGNSSIGWTFVERWNTVGGVPADAVGRRTATALNPAFPIVAGQTFTVGEVVLARAGPGAGGTEYEIIKAGVGGCFRFLDDMTDPVPACVDGAITSLTYTRVYKWFKNGVVYDSDPGCP